MQNDKRDRLLDLLEQAEGQVNNDVPSLESIADYLIANDVVPVVKCKNCIYNKGQLPVPDSNIIRCHREMPKLRSLNDFCSYGERKDNNA